MNAGPQASPAQDTRRQTTTRDSNDKFSHEHWKKSLSAKIWWQMTCHHDMLQYVGDKSCSSLNSENISQHVHSVHINPLQSVWDESNLLDWHMNFQKEDWCSLIQFCHSYWFHCNKRRKFPFLPIFSQFTKSTLDEDTSLMLIYSRLWRFLIIIPTSSIFICPSRMIIIPPHTLFPSECVEFSSFLPSVEDIQFRGERCEYYWCVSCMVASEHGVKLVTAKWLHHIQQHCCLLKQNHCIPTCRN